MCNRKTFRLRLSTCTFLSKPRLNESQFDVITTSPAEEVLQATGTRGALAWKNLSAHTFSVSTRTGIGPVRGLTLALPMPKKVL